MTLFSEFHISVRVGNNDYLDAQMSSMKNNFAKKLPRAVRNRIRGLPMNTTRQ